MPKLTLVCWTNRPLRRGITVTSSRHDYMHTRLCPDCRHRSCTSTKGRYTPLRGMCDEATPSCLSDEERLFDMLGAPKTPWNPARGSHGREVYRKRKAMVEQYLHKHWLKCRKVKVSIKLEGK